MSDFAGAPADPQPPAAFAFGSQGADWGRPPAPVSEAAPADWFSPSPVSAQPSAPLGTEFSAAAPVSDWPPASDLDSYWDIPVELASPDGTGGAQLAGGQLPAGSFTPPPTAAQAAPFAPPVDVWGSEEAVGIFDGQAGPGWADEAAQWLPAPESMADPTASGGESAALNAAAVNRGGTGPLAAPVPAEAAAYVAELTADEDEDMGWEGPPEIGPDGRGPWLDGADAPWGTAPSQAGRRALTGAAWGVGLGVIAAIVQLFLLT
jgi:hypothetical protein